MKKNVSLLFTLIFSVAILFVSCSSSGKMKSNKLNHEKSVENIKRAVQLTERAFDAHFVGEDMAMARFYNPYLETRSDEYGSIWMYTSAIESVNAIMHALKENKSREGKMLNTQYFDKMEDLLANLYAGADFYLGTFSLTSYTQTKDWTIYGVNRGASKGNAKVDGIENVYDDQMWLIRELVESYKLTNNKQYLELAEYLADYVLDGWDTTIDENGNERGGIPWGPGYVSKHSCSNGPLISPLVWLHEIYSGSDDVVTYNYIDSADRISRKSKQMKKSDYYLMYAERVYEWQKKHLLRADGVYDDFMGGCTPRNPETELINGVSYRKGITCPDIIGPAYSYNTGTMLSGAADLYRATGNNDYLADGIKLSDASFSYFASLSADVDGYHAFAVSGFNNWFNGVLMRGYVDMYPYYNGVSQYIDAFQKNLDYGYSNHLYKGVLPANLLKGWDEDNNKNNSEGMFSFTFGAEYAVLSAFELVKK